MTQAELAEKAGVNQSVIGSLEAGPGTSSKYTANIAKALGVSVSNLLSEDTPIENPQIRFADELYTMLDRFFQVFKVHKIPVAKIPCLLTNIRRSTMLHPESLSDSLSPLVINKMCDFFRVEENWLLGFSEIIYKPKKWQSDIYALCRNIIFYKNQGYKIEVIYCSNQKINNKVFEHSKKYESDESSLEIGIVLQLVKQQRGVKFKSYEVWESIKWNHFKSRVRLKAVIMFCLKHKIEQCSRNLTQSDFNNIYEGKNLAYPFFEKIVPYSWYPDDFISTSDRNPDLDELKFVKEEYLERGLDELTKQFNNLDTGA
ncbi:MAG: helix-turn-helix transcriptional regulator [Pasteurella sp.]|nr:helix-turn-helix transcriptional regulator [Pasteurella sp.]